jgi:hypothetical protein
MTVRITSMSGSRSDEVNIGSQVPFHIQVAVLDTLLKFERDGFNIQVVEYNGKDSRRD